MGQWCHVSVPGIRTIEKAQAYLSAKLSAYMRKLHPDSAEGPTIADCIERFLKAKGLEVTEETLHQNRAALEEMRDYAASRGVHYMRELSVDLLESFKTDMKRVKGDSSLQDTTRVTKFAKIKSFMKEAYRRGWCTDIGSKVKHVKATYRHEGMTNRNMLPRSRMTKSSACWKALRNYQKRTQSILETPGNVQAPFGIDA